MGRYGASGLGRGEGRINSEDFIVRPHDDDPDITKHYSNSFYFVVKKNSFYFQNKRFFNSFYFQKNSKVPAGIVDSR